MSAEEDRRWHDATNDVRAFVASVLARVGQREPADVEARIAEDAAAARAALSTLAEAHDHHCKGCICRQLTIIAHGILRERGAIEALRTADYALDHYTHWHRQREHAHALS